MTLPRITHLGTATLVIDIDGLRIVTDPVLDGAGTVHRLFPGIGYRHVSGDPVQTNLLGKADVVLLSHDNHLDNLDAGGLELTRRARIVVTHAAGAARLGRHGIEPVALAPGERHDVPLAAGGTLRVTATPGRHGPPGTLWLTGPVIGFLLESPSLPGPLYITGDTRWYGGLARWWQGRGDVPHTVIAHAGAAQIWGLRFSMNAREVAGMAAALAPKQLIPIHYGEWSHFREGQEALRKGLESREVANVRWLPLRSPERL